MGIKRHINQKGWQAVVFLLGILLAQLAGAYVLSDNPLDAWHLHNFAAQKTGIPELFETVLWERAKLFFVLFLLCETRAKRWVRKCAPAAVLFLLGMFAGLCMAAQGVAGIGLFVFALFPHAAFYLLALFWMTHKKKPVQYSGKRYVFTEIVSVLLIFLTIFLGCATEAAAGEYLLKRYLLAFISASS